MLRLLRLSTLVVHCLVLIPCHGENRLCHGDRCHGDPSFAATSTTDDDNNRRMTCPASDCDGTGDLQHHFGSVNAGSSAACQFFGANNMLEYTLQNSYFRCFRGDLCTTDRVVDAVTFGVSVLSGASAVLVTINLYKGGITGCDSTETVAELFDQIVVASTAITVSAGTNIMDIRVPFASPVLLQPDETILVEVFVPDLEVARGILNLADSNEVGQCDPSYIFFTQCSSVVLESPVPLASLNITTVSYMIGLETSTVPTIPPALAPVPMPVSAAPVLPPTPQPIPLPPIPNPPNGSPVPAPPAFCLSDRNLVFVQGRGCISIADVRVGDCIAAETHPDAPCTRVYSLAHFQPNVTATFWQFYSTLDDTTPMLEITSEHLVFSQGRAVPAKDLRVGHVVDTLGSPTAPLTIGRIAHIERKGVFAPLTESGELPLVQQHGGKTPPPLRVSSYVDFWHGLMPYPHAVVHWFLALPIRSGCRWAPDWCAAERHDRIDGYSSLYSTAIRILAWMGGNARSGGWQLLVTRNSLLAMVVTVWLLGQRRRRKT